MLSLQAIGHEGPLHITSRLDHCTEGLLLLAKSAGFAALYNHLQRSKTEGGEACVQKFYRALSLVPPPTGECCGRADGGSSNGRSGHCFGV